MKTTKVFLYFFAIATFLMACSKSNNEFKIEGKITGELKDSVYLYYENDSGKMIILGEALAENGEFTLTGKVNTPVIASLMLRNSGDNNYYSDNQATIILEPGKIKFEAKTGDFINASISGGTGQQDFNSLANLKKTVYSQLQEIYKSAEKAKDAEQADSIKKTAEPLMEEAQKIDLAFFEEHPASIATAYSLQMYVSSLDYEKLTYYYDRLSPEIKQSKLGKNLLSEINALKAGSPGAIAANFTAVDMNGKSFSLSDFKGKYIIIDFWATWCVPCRKSFPHMISLYNQYKDKGLDVICIADDDRNQEAWKAAIEKDQTSMWHHTLRGFDMEKRMKNEENENDLSDKFGIHALPTKILVNPEGVIIGRYVGNDEKDNSLDTKLKEIFS